MKKINRYMCEYCKKHYEIKADALECEAICSGEMPCTHIEMIYWAELRSINLVIAKCSREGCSYKDEIQINDNDAEKIYKLLNAYKSK